MDYIVVVINVVTMGEANMGHKRPANLTLSIVEQVFMVMVEVDIGLRPATLPYTTQVDVVDCWFYNFLLVLLKKMFMVTRKVGIGIRPSTLPPIIQVGVTNCCVNLLLQVTLTKKFMAMIGVIYMASMENTYLGLKRPSTLIFTIAEKMLMVMVEEDIGLIPDTKPTMTQMDVVYCWLYLLFLVLSTKVFMVKKYVILVVTM